MTQDSSLFTDAPPPSSPPQDASLFTDQPPPQAPSYSLKTPSGFPEPQVSDNPAAGSEVPIGAKILGNLGTVAGGYGIGTLATMGAIAAGKGVSSFFQASPDLLNAGIKPSTVLKMTPPGQNPAEYAKTLENNLNQSNALGSDASETWQKMDALKNMHGQNVGKSLQDIANAAGPRALTVDADSALKPVLDGWAERADAATTARQAMARPFQQVYNKLAAKAAANGGKLGLEDIRGVMDEIGPMTHKGSEIMQQAMSELYGTLANTRDAMVKTVAQQAGNPALAQNLLNANAGYSQYMRLMPDVSKAAASQAIQQGLSTFEKIGGPTILRYAAGAGGIEALKGLVWPSKGSGQ